MTSKSNKMMKVIRNAVILGICLGGHAMAFAGDHARRDDPIRPAASLPPATPLGLAGAERSSEF